MVGDTQLAQCTGKIRFRSYKAAKRLALQVSRRKELTAKPYPCKWCHGFHVGTSLGGEPSTAPYARKPFAVYAAPPDGTSILVGWSAHEDGHEVAAMLGEGWRITSVVRRARVAR